MDFHSSIVESARRGKDEEAKQQRAMEVWAAEKRAKEALLAIPGQVRVGQMSRV